MTEKIERYKPRDEWTPDEIVQHGRTGQRPERKEYREARREALAEAGLEPDDDDAEGTPLDEMSPDQHLQRIQRS